jgi:hypothetical protein
LNNLILKIIIYLINKKILLYNKLFHLALNIF